MSTFLFLKNDSKFIWVKGLKGTWVCTHLVFIKKCNTIGYHKKIFLLFDQALILCSNYDHMNIKTLSGLKI